MRLYCLLIFFSSLELHGDGNKKRFSSGSAKTNKQKQSGGPAAGSQPARLIAV